MTINFQPPLVTGTSRSSTEVRADDWAYLRGGSKPYARPVGERLSFVDLFSGCGGMSLGVAEAARDHGLDPFVGAAVDFVTPASSVYSANFGPERVHLTDVSTLMPTDVREPVTDFETRTLAASGGRIHVLVGGPPCQGHSDLNNHTRRDDPKNALYLVMARAGLHLRPDAIVVENVHGSRFDRGGAVWKTASLLEEAGYRVDTRIVDLSDIGVAQRRRRFVMLATLRDRPSIGELLEPFAVGTPRPLSWAIDDVCEPEQGIMGATSRMTPENGRRVDYLFDHGLHDLPDSERPACHRDKPHSYSSVYGRLHADRPAPTLTGGFYTMGMGRYVHPTRRRTLTAREAARIQFFPDTFRFDEAGGRMALAKMLGNAVPMKLTYALVAGMISSGTIDPASRR